MNNCKRKKRQRHHHPNQFIFFFKMSIPIPIFPATQDEILTSIQEYENKEGQHYFVKTLNTNNSYFPAIELYHRENDESMLFLFKSTTPATLYFWWSDDVSSSSDLLQISNDSSISLNEQTKMQTRSSQFFILSEGSQQMIQTSYFTPPSRQSIRIDIGSHTTALVRLHNMKLKRVCMRSELGQNNINTLHMKTKSNSVGSVTRTLEEIQTLVAQTQEQVKEISFKSSSLLSSTTSMDSATSTKIEYYVRLITDKFPKKKIDIGVVFARIKFESDNVDGFKKRVRQLGGIDEETLSDLITLLYPELNTPLNDQNTKIVASKPKPIVNKPSNKDSTTFAGRNTDSGSGETDKFSFSLHSCTDSLKELMYKMKRK